MRILQIDKFLNAASPAAGGLGAYLPLVTRLLRQAGHTVLHFGCLDEQEAGLPQWAGLSWARFSHWQPA